MSANGWITVGVVVAMVAAMALSLAGPDMVLAAGLTLLVATGVLGPDEAFQGFANPAVVTIGALFVVAAGVRETGALDYVGRRVLGTPRNVPGAQLRVMLPVGALSAFLNNTPVVAMFVLVALYELLDCPGCFNCVPGLRNLNQGSYAPTTLVNGKPIPYQVCGREVALPTQLRALGD